VTGIERKLKCTCGCNLDVFTCRTTDFTCATSPAMHKEVVAYLEAGSTPEQVVAAFVAEYGEEVLMAPTTEGFNLAGYLVPGLALTIAGGALAAVLLRRHQLSRPAADGVARAGADGRGVRSMSGASDAEMARLEQALLDVDR
jgi:cytochrome c-type biogenesis protein CcmH